MGASKNKDILKKVLDFAMSVSYLFNHYKNMVVMFSVIFVNYITYVLL